MTGALDGVMVMRDGYYSCTVMLQEYVDGVTTRHEPVVLGALLPGVEIVMFADLLLLGAGIRPQGLRAAGVVIGDG